MIMILMDTFWFMGMVQCQQHLGGLVYVLAVDDKNGDQHGSQQVPFSLPLPLTKSKCNNDHK